MDNSLACDSTVLSQDVFGMSLSQLLTSFYHLFHFWCWQGQLSGDLKWVSKDLISYEMYGSSNKSYYFGNGGLVIKSILINLIQRFLLVQTLKASFMLQCNFCNFLCKLQLPPFKSHMVKQIWKMLCVSAFLLFQQQTLLVVISAFYTSLKMENTVILDMLSILKCILI